MLTNIVLVIAAYLIGSISTATLVCKALGLPDPRSAGSHNPGATNVMRIAGKKPAALTLLGDLIKGVLPVVAAHLAQMPPITVAAVGFSAFIGHLYPVFFRFQGGKGVATALGVLLAMAWQVGIAAACTWLVIAKIFRISSLSALIAAIVTPFFAWFFSVATAYLVACIAISLLIVWRHRSNVRRLLAREETTIGN